MRTTYCQQCGAAVYSGHSSGGEVLIDQGPPRGNRNLIKVKPADGIGPSTVHSLHACDQIIYPKRVSTRAIDAARRAVGLEPLPTTNPTTPRPDAASGTGRRE